MKEDRRPTKPTDITAIAAIPAIPAISCYTCYMVSDKDYKSVEQWKKTVDHQSQLTKLQYLQ